MWITLWWVLEVPSQWWVWVFSDRLIFKCQPQEKIYTVDSWNYSCTKNTFHFALMMLFIRLDAIPYMYVGKIERKMCKIILLRELWAIFTLIVNILCGDDIVFRLVEMWRYEVLVSLQFFSSSVGTRTIEH